ncbi:MAG: hypothetical protein EOO16_13090 [Chitinophagaceae bacterium]|nr:MAG: hypothetical protein EOO16_13090 [Chitinophagaceae bacterium]
MKSYLLLIIFGAGALTASAQESAPVVAADSTINETFVRVDVEASYPGGQKAWIEYLTKNLNGDAAGRDVVIPKRSKEVMLTARVQFMVSKDGVITEARVVNKVPPSVEREALRVIQNSGRWIPAQQNNRTVRAYRTQPITFVFTN